MNNSNKITIDELKSSDAENGNVPIDSKYFRVESTVNKWCKLFSSDNAQITNEDKECVYRRRKKIIPLI